VRVKYLFSPSRTRPCNFLGGMFGPNTYDRTKAHRLSRQGRQDTKTKDKHQDKTRHTPRQDKTNTKTRTDDKTIKRRTKTLEEGRHHLTHSISFHRGLQDKTRQDKIRQDKHQDQTTHDKTCWSLDSSLTGRTRVMHLRSTRQGI
jgi:hypothetical protein